MRKCVNTWTYLALEWLERENTAQTFTGTLSFHYLTYYLPIYTAWYTTTPVRHKVSPTSLTLLLPTMTDCTVTKSISLPGMACLSCCVSVYLKLILLKLLPYLLTISTSLYIWIFRFSFQFNYNHSNVLSLFQVALLDVHFPPLPSPPLLIPFAFLKKNQKNYITQWRFDFMVGLSYIVPLRIF